MRWSTNTRRYHSNRQLFFERVSAPEAFEFRSFLFGREAKAHGALFLPKEVKALSLKQVFDLVEKYLWHTASLVALYIGIGRKNEVCLDYGHSYFVEFSSQCIVPVIHSQGRRTQLATQWIWQRTILALPLLKFRSSQGQVQSIRTRSGDSTDPWA